MKEIIFAVTLLLLTFNFNAAQKNTTSSSKKPIKQAHVTAQTIAAQPAGKAYVIDLTRKGTIYTLDAGIDYSRIRVVTPTGERALSDVINNVGLKQLQTGGKLRLASFGDLLEPTGGVSPMINCSASATCVCTGFSHCLLLELGGCCRTQMECTASGCWCWKTTRPGCTGIKL